MTTLTWLGGGNNKASNPKHWSTGKVPQSGDFLQVQFSAQPYTMNVSGNNLSGDTVRTFNANFTANLSHSATMVANLVTSSVGTFNLSQHSTLDLSLISGFHVGVNTAIINMSGADTLTLHNTDSQVTVNLLSGSRWNGNLDAGQFFGVTFGKTTVNGGPHSSFNNNGHSVIYNTEQAVINTDVVGVGTFDVSNQGARGNLDPLPNSIARMEFAGSVGPNQSISNSGLLVIDWPNQFSGHVYLSTFDGGTPTNPLFPAEIDLMRLATADSYTYKNDMLSIFSGKSVIDQLHLTDKTIHGFVVGKTASSVNIIAISDLAHPPGELPIHL